MKTNVTVNQDLIKRTCYTLDHFHNEYNKYKETNFYIFINMLFI